MRLYREEMCADHNVLSCLSCLRVGDSDMCMREYVYVCVRVLSMRNYFQGPRSAGG